MRFNHCLAFVSGPVSCSASLLCDTVTVPAVPSFRGTNEFLRTKWLEAGEALANQQGSKARHIFLSATDQTFASDSALCGFLFDAAHRLLAGSCQTAADQCIQQGLSLLACGSDRTRDVFIGPYWLVMASSALIRRDFESCGVWLRRARQSLRMANSNQGVLSQELQHWNGDWFAIEACLQAGIGDLDKALSLLSSARQCHIEAGAFTSAAKDLLLRSRRRMLESQWDAAESDLLEAKTFIRLPDSADDDLQRNDLSRAIENDLTKVRTRIGSLFAAKWN